MSKIKKFSMTLLSAFICFASVFIFAGCKDDKEYSKLYVFSTEGGSVQVNDETELVEFGDEGSRIFSFEEESVVHLKAIPDEGYSFVKWEYSDDIDEDYSIFSSNAEIDLIMDEDIISIKAIFEENEADTYSVSYSSGAGYSITPEAGSNASVEEGGSFSFRVGVLEGYDDTTLSVKVNGVNIIAVDGVYTIADIAENKTITVGVSKYKYSVTLNNGTGYTIVPEANQLTNNIEYGTTFSFKVELDEKYNNSEFVVNATGEGGATPLTADSNGVYSLIINQDYIITVEGVEVDTYVVTLPSVSYVNVTPIQAEVVDNKVELEEGESLSFTISSTNPELDLSNMIVSVNDGTSTTTVTANEGVYTISNISRNVSVTISNIGVTTYSVTESDDKFSISIIGGKTEFTKGEDVSFTMTLATGYKKGTEFKVFADGNELTGVEGVYTIENIYKNIEITATGIEIITSEVSLPATNDMYSIEAMDGYTTTVNYGNDFKFTITIKEGYVKGADFVVKAGDTTLVESNGEYIIENIIEDVVVTVEGIVVGEYAVSYAAVPGVTVKMVEGYDNTVNYGEDFKFVVEVSEGYIKGRNFIVKANGNEVVDEEGVYTISNITQNVIITIEGVGEPLVVSYENKAEYTLTAVEGYNATVIAGEEFKFTVAVNEGYSKTAEFAVKAGEQTLTEVEGVYTISNITEDVSILIVGIAEVLDVTFVQPNDISVAQILYNDEVATTANVLKNADINVVVKVPTMYQHSVELNVSDTTLNVTQVSTNNDATHAYITYKVANVAQSINISVSVIAQYNYSIDYSNISLVEEEFHNTGIYNVSLYLDMTNLPVDSDGSDIEVQVDGDESITNLKQLIELYNDILAGDAFVMNIYLGEDTESMSEEALIPINYEESGFTLTINKDELNNDYTTMFLSFI